MWEKIRKNKRKKNEEINPKIKKKAGNKWKDRRKGMTVKKKKKKKRKSDEKKELNTRKKNKI